MSYRSSKTFTEQLLRDKVIDSVPWLIIQIIHHGWNTDDSWQVWRLRPAGALLNSCCSLRTRQAGKGQTMGVLPSGYSGYSQKNPSHFFFYLFAICPNWICMYDLCSLSSFNKAASDHQTLNQQVNGSGSKQMALSKQSCLEWTINYLNVV